MVRQKQDNGAVSKTEDEFRFKGTSADSRMKEEERNCQLGSPIQAKASA